MQKTFCDKCGEEIKDDNRTIEITDSFYPENDTDKHRSVFSKDYKFYEICSTCFDSLNLKAK